MFNFRKKKIETNAETKLRRDKENAELRLKWAEERDKTLMAEVTNLKLIISQKECEYRALESSLESSCTYRNNRIASLEDDVKMWRKAAKRKSAAIKKLFTLALPICDYENLYSLIQPELDPDSLLLYLSSDFSRSWDDYNLVHETRDVGYDGYGYGVVEPRFQREVSANGGNYLVVLKKWISNEEIQKLYKKFIEDYDDSGSHLGNFEDIDK